MANAYSMIATITTGGGGAIEVSLPACYYCAYNFVTV